MESAVNHHHMWDVLADVLLILALAGVLIPLLGRVRISPVLGYLFCGLVIGPYGLGVLGNDFRWLSAFYISDTGLIYILAELGVMFLLFMIGLELTLSRLWGMRKLVLGLGSAQIIVTGIILFVIALQFDNALPTAILIGAAFALSSTAMVMQILTERHIVSRPVGRVSFSVLLMQDLAVVPILVLIGAFSGDNDASVVYLVAKALVTACVVVVCIFASGKLLLRPSLKILGRSRNDEWLFAVVMFLVMGVAALTHSFGLSAALGAFLAGLLIAETEYRHQIEVMIAPVKGILMGIFFLSVGMMINLAYAMEHIVWLPLSVIGIFVLKTVITYPLARLFGIPSDVAAQSSVMLAQCGEFAFIVIGLARVGGLIPEQDAQFFLLVAAFSMLVTPFTTAMAPFAGKLFEKEADSETMADIEGIEDVRNHIIIAGFGRVGQTLAQILESQKIPYMALDSDVALVSKFHEKGYPVIAGNARQLELWNKLGIETAKAAVITIDDHTQAESILKVLRHHWPLIPIIIRVKDTIRLASYYEHGATDVVPEAFEATLQLADSVLRASGISADEVGDIVQQQRQALSHTGLS